MARVYPEKETLDRYAQSGQYLDSPWSRRNNLKGMQMGLSNSWLKILGYVAQNRVSDTLLDQNPEPSTCIRLQTSLRCRSARFKLTIGSPYDPCRQGSSTRPARTADASLRIEHRQIFKTQRPWGSRRSPALWSVQTQMPGTITRTWPSTQPVHRHRGEKSFGGWIVEWSDDIVRVGILE